MAATRVVIRVPHYYRMMIAYSMVAPEFERLLASKTRLKRSNGQGWMRNLWAKGALGPSSMRRFG